MPRSGLGFMGGLRRQWGPPVCGCRLGHMSLTRERGAQTEGKATTQHHCPASVDSFELRHHSPREETNKDRNRRRSKRDKALTQKKKTAWSWHHLLLRLSCQSGQTCKQTLSRIRQMERNQLVTSLHKAF